MLPRDDGYISGTSVHTAGGGAPASVFYLGSHCDFGGKKGHRIFLPDIIVTKLGTVILLIDDKISDVVLQLGTRR